MEASTKKKLSKYLITASVVVGMSLGAVLSEGSRKDVLFTGDLNESTEHLLFESPDKINLIINSRGGLVHSANSIEALIRHKNINTYVSSVAYSGGAFLFLLGKERVMDKEAKLMIHGARVMMGSIFGSDVINAKRARELAAKAKEENKKDEEKTYAELAERLEDVDRGLIRIYTKNLSKQVADVVREAVLSGEDVFFSAEEALKAGLATKVDYGTE